MNSVLSERLKAFRLPPVSPLPGNHFIVVHLFGLGFDGLFSSPEFDFESAFDARFGKLMVQTASMLLGGDACGRYGYAELTQFSLLLDQERARSRFEDATDLQSYLVALASAKMSLLLDAEALFLCRLYAFPSRDLVLAYFTWRQQEAYLGALDGYCSQILRRTRQSSREEVAALLVDLGPREKQEILRQNNIEYDRVPAWQRYGVGVHLDGEELTIVTDLPHDERYRSFIEQRLAPGAATGGGPSPPPQAK